MQEQWNKLTIDNWNFCQYKSSKLKAFISLGGAPNRGIIYYVTCADLEDKKEFFQKEYDVLEEALLDINFRYGRWPLNDLRIASDDAGCSTCSAK